MVGTGAPSLDEQGSTPRILIVNSTHPIQKGDSFVKNLFPNISKMIHNLAGWAYQPAQEPAQEQPAQEPHQDPQNPEDEMDEFFPCIDRHLSFAIDYLKNCIF